MGGAGAGACERIKKMRKNRKNKGETLIETLTALLIVVLVMVMLPASVVTAARINAKAKEQETTCNVSLKSNPQRSSVTMTASGDYSGVEREKNYTITLYRDNGFYYYEQNS